MNIFVGNLSRDATEEDLRQAFAAYGQVDRCRSSRTSSPGSRAVSGFVEMANKTEAQAAITGLNQRK